MMDLLRAFLPIYLYSSGIIGGLCLFTFVAGAQDNANEELLTSIVKYGVAYTFMWPILLPIHIIKICWKVLVEVIKGQQTTIDFAQKFDMVLI